jgi:hypothetical protein
MRDLQKTNLGLAKWAREWLGRPYWYGTVCYKCTEDLLERKKRQYPKHYTKARMARYRADIKAGRRCTDCIGLAKGYMWWDEADGKAHYATNGCPDQSANGMYELARVKGKLDTLPEVPGIMLWKEGHAGVYMGGGRVIEARGFDYGVVETKLHERSWGAWYQLPGCEYIVEPTHDGNDAEGCVRITGGSVNLRTGPSTDYGIADVAHAGDVLEMERNVDSWHAVRVDGRVLWVSPEYSEVVGT